MVDEGDKTKVGASGGTEAPVSKDPSKKTGGFKRILFFGGLGLGVIVLGIALALFVIKPMTSDSGGRRSDAPELAQEKAPKHGSKAKKEQVKPKKRKERSERESSGIYAIRDIVINPAGTGGTRFLSVSFAFDLASPELEAEFREREAVVRDALITILSSKTVAQLTDPKQKEIVRYQIRKRVSDLMKTDKLDGVYYTDFVLQ